MSDRQPNPSNQIKGGQVPFFLKSIKYLGSAWVEFDHSKELDRTSGYALVENSIIKLKEFRKQSDNKAAANLPWVKVMVSNERIGIEDPKTKKVEHVFSMKNVAYFGLGETAYRENIKKYFALLVKGTAGSREYSHCFIFLSDKFAKVLHNTVKQAIDNAHQQPLSKYKDGDKKSLGEEKDKESQEKNRHEFLEEEIEVLKARLKDVAKMVNKKQLTAYMNKNRIQDLTRVELESIEVAIEDEKMDFRLQGSENQETMVVTPIVEEDKSLVRENKESFDLLRMNSLEIPTLNILAPTTDNASAKVAFETNFFDFQTEIPQNTPQHDINDRSGLPKSDSWTSLDLDLSPVSLSSRGNSTPGSFNNVLSSPSNNFQAGPRQTFGQNLTMEQPMSVDQNLWMQSIARPSSCPPGLGPKYPNLGNTNVFPSAKIAGPFQRASSEETYSKLSDNFTTGSTHKTENSFSDNFSTPCSMPTSNPFPTSASNQFQPNSTNSFPVMASNPFTGNTASLFHTTANNPFPTTANNPFPDMGNNPFPISANKPFPATANNHFPAIGNNPLPVTTNNPFPVTTKNPLPQAAANLYPQAVNRMFQTQGNNPFPTATSNNSFPIGSTKPTHM